MARKKINFEERLQALETLVDSLEEGDLTLEESLKAFEEGIKLTRECQSVLTEAEQKVAILVEKQGELTTQPFKADED